MTKKPDPTFWEATLTEYAEVVEQQRDSVRAIAEKMDTGIALDRGESLLAAAILLGWARDLKDTPPRKRGQPPQFNHFDAQFLYLAYVNKGRMKKSVAVATIAELFGVTIEAMKQCIKKTPEGVKALFGEP